MGQLERSPAGASGPNLHPSAANYCYTKSCGRCKDNCDWTTCHDCVTPTGTGLTNVNGFFVTLLNILETSLCIDRAREYLSGESKGGMMACQTGPWLMGSTAV